MNITWTNKLEIPIQLTNLALTISSEINFNERSVLYKLQRGLTAVNSWCERIKIKINEG
jgi:hypothetical protein